MNYIETKKESIKRITLAAWVLAIIFLAMTLVTQTTAVGGDSSNEPIMSDSARVTVLYRHYDDLDSLVRESDAIFEGEVIDSGTVVGGGLDKRDTEETTVPTTLHKVKIIDTFKGDGRTDDTVEIAMLGGTVDSRLFFVDGAPKIEKGQKYLIFGLGNGETPYAILAGGMAIAKRTDANFVLPEGVGNFAKENNRIDVNDIESITNN